jgi:hypothetical protein
VITPQDYTMLRVLASLICDFVESPGLTVGLAHVGCSQGVETCQSFSLLGVPTEKGDFGETWASDVLPSAFFVYGRWWATRKKARKVSLLASRKEPFLSCECSLSFHS